MNVSLLHARQTAEAETKIPERAQAAKASSRQEVQCQAIRLILLLLWLQDGVDVGMKNNSDSGEFLLFS